MAHTLPDLPYSFDALEPAIDARTMEIHHGKHHAAYLSKLNGAIEGNADLEAMSIEDLCANLDRVPETGAWIIALPMKIAGGSGGPVRIVALTGP